MHTSQIVTGTDEAQTNEPKTRMSGEDRREAILEVATDIFLTEGYAGASMSTIAAKLGGSKGTLYNYFKNKDELFTAYVMRHCEFHRGQVSDLLLEDGTAREVLTRFARRYVEVSTTERMLQNWRLITAECKKSPDVGRAFYEAGPKRGAELLADYMRKAVTRGELVMDDPVMAAHQFTSLIHGRLIKARLLNYCPLPTEAEIEAEVEAAMFVFFAAYGAKNA
ncbi:MAG: TetR/AcrR family transcriptional regulator [Asticcacaulis sp.]